jgi:glycerophosphoryl diester phosphodiesterase
VFDLTEKTYTGDRWRYTMDERGVGIGDFQLDADGRGLVIERDASEGDVKGLKVVQAIDLGESGGVVTKQPLVDLLALADPHGVAPEQAGDVGVGGGMFALPFVTIESLVILGEDRLLIANDNNFPFGVGRHTGTMQPDDNEMVFIALPPG